MKVDKQNLPIFISIILSLITFYTIWVFGGTALLITQKLLPVVSGLWVLIFLLALSVPKLRGKVSSSAITNAFIIYLGALFISLARFKEEIAKVNIDVNMLGVGLALIAIALGLTTQGTKNDNKNLPVSPTMPLVSNKVKELGAVEKPTSINIVLDEVRRKLDFQFEQLDGLDTKSGIVLGVAGVIFTLLVTSMLEQSNITDNTILAKIALAPIFVSLVLSFVPLYIRKWNRPPNIERLRSYYIVENSEETKLKIIDISMQAIRDNDKLLMRIIRLIKFSYIFLLIGLALLAIWIGIIIW